MILLTEHDIKAAKILVIDDELINLIAVSELLDIDGYKNVSTFSDPKEAVEAYKQSDFDLVLLDINMPELDGFEVMDAFSQINKKIPPPVLVLTAQISKSVRNKALKGGARDFVTKPFDAEEMLSRVCNLLEMHLSQKTINNYSENLEKVVSKRTQELIETQFEIVQRLGYAAEYRDTETADHTIRVGEYARILGEYLGLRGEELQHLYHTAPMHDIGKIGIADSILLKPGVFTPEEYKIMETHTTIGSEILRGDKSRLLKVARKIALTHHERWDGTGYPNGLAGEDIPLCGRIVMVADVFDALTMKRVYKDAWSDESAYKFMNDNSGSMFDPKVIEAFNQEYEKFQLVKSSSDNVNSEKV